MENKGKHLGKTKSYKKIVIAILVILFISIVGLYIFNKKQIKNNPVNSEFIEEEKINTITNEHLNKLKELKEINPDIKCWLQIENTEINYPVVQTTNNDYYLTHNYKKEESKYGSIYIKDVCDINDKNSNVIIYGHNMKDEKMFNELLKYEDEKFYNEHKNIKITTENEQSNYSIISVFKSRVFYKDEKDVFRYYNYIKFDNEDVYNQYIKESKKIELYNTGISANYGEQLLTLITCEYSQENGRFVVIAKKDN